MIVPGNAQVVALFERMLALAKEGNAGYAFAAVCGEDGAPTVDGSGLALLEPVALEAAKAITAKLEARALNRVRPPADAALDASYVCYDVPNAPLSYDFIPWLIDAEMTRIREGAPAPLKVAFWFGRDGKAGLELPSRRQMYVHVVRPALALIGARLDDAALAGRHKPFYNTRDIVTAARAGEPVPRLRTSNPAWATSGPVTITLREAEHWPHRNSNIEAWLRFADHLVGQGEVVTFVRDTAKAHEPLGSHQTFPAASTHLAARMALYAGSKLNFFVSNGPGVLALFSHAPWVQFINLQNDDHPYKPDTAQFYRDYMGLERGGQHPWCRPEQRIFWGPDTFENIMAAWAPES